MADRWTLHPLASLHWRQFEGDWLVYDDLSGDTHMMDTLGAAVLTCLEPRVPLAMTDLLAQLHTDFAIEADAARVTPIVLQLRALGLLVQESSFPADHTALHAAA